MIVGILLLYIGMKCNFPTLYLIACWIVILLRAFAFILGFADGYKGKK